MPTPIGGASSQPVNSELDVAAALSGLVSPPAQASGEPQENSVIPHPGQTSAPTSAAPPDGLSPAAQTAVTNASELLETHVSKLDFMVTESEAKQALGAVTGLSPQDFRAAVNELSSTGHLATLIDTLPWDDQCRFLAVAEEKGMVGQQLGERPTGPADPPPRPDLYRHDVKLPREMNDLIHEHSKAQVSQFKAAYEAYQDRFAEQVSNAKTPAEIRQLGSPDSGHTSWELTDLRDPSNSQYDRDWSASMVCGPTRIYRAISDRMSELTGERKEGSVWLEVKVEGHVSSVGGEATLDTGKRGDMVHGELAWQHPVGESGEVKLKEDEVEGSLKLKAPGGSGAPQVGGKIAVDGGGNVKQLNVDVGPVGARYHERKGVGARVTAVETGGDGGAKGEVGSTSYVNPTAAELRGGVYGKVGLGEILDGQVDVSLGLKGLTPKSASRSLAHLTGNREGAMDVPSELREGKPWASLPPARREFLEGLHWSESEWKERLAKGGDR